MTILYDLLQLSHEKKIKYSEDYLRKADEQELVKILKEYQLEELDAANDQMSVLLVKGTVEGLKMLNAVEYHQQLEQDLLKDKLLRRDLKKTLSYNTPWIPFAGYFSGLMTITRHITITIHMRKKPDESFFNFILGDETDDSDMERKPTESERSRQESERSRHIPERSRQEWEKSEDIH